MQPQNGERQNNFIGIKYSPPLDSKENNVWGFPFRWTTRNEVCPLTNSCSFFLVLDEHK